MNALFGFLASTNGRIVRSVAGLVLILVGLLVIGGTAGVIVALIGVAPLAAGVFDVCLFAPLFGLAFKGSELRK
ncbi:MAG: DUF2892 domain-containing protein [Anaerolineae bacterium]|nr:DUF2892 domain-containing protein [Anaerolineae bacterium]